MILLIITVSGTTSQAALNYSYSSLLFVDSHSTALLALKTSPKRPIQWFIHCSKSMVFHHNYRIQLFSNRWNGKLSLLTIARFHLLLSVTFFLPKLWFIAPAKLVSTDMTCMAFLLLGPTLLCPQKLSEVLMYATFTEPVAVGTSAFSDIL